MKNGGAENICVHAYADRSENGNECYLEETEGECGGDDAGCVGRMQDRSLHRHPLHQWLLQESLTHEAQSGVLKTQKLLFLMLYSVHCMYTTIIGIFQPFLDMIR